MSVLYTLNIYFIIYADSCARKTHLRPMQHAVNEKLQFLTFSGKMIY